MTAQRFHSKNTSIWYGSNEYHLKIALYQIKVVAKSWLNCMKIKARHEKYEGSCCTCSCSLCCVSLEISFDVGMFHRNWPYGLSRKFIGAWVFKIIFIYLRLIIWRKFLEIPKCWNVDNPPFPPHKFTVYSLVTNALWSHAGPIAAQLTSTCQRMCTAQYSPVCGTNHITYCTSFMSYQLSNLYTFISVI